MSYMSNASQRVSEYIIGKLETEEWKPGMRIDTEESMCKSLHVSRVAVRQGVEKLSSLGVLRKIQGSGTYVNKMEDSSLEGLMYYPPNYKTLRMVLEFRRMFDSRNVELFIEHARKVDISILKQNYIEMAGNADDREYFELMDNNFHEMIAKGTKNILIQQISDTLTSLLLRHQSLQYDLVGPDNAIKWHGRIVEAIENRDKELARRYTRVHIDAALEKLNEVEAQLAAEEESAKKEQAK